MKILWQLQLSNYTPEGKFVLTADSNWQMFATKVAQVTQRNDDVYVDVVVPELKQCLEDPRELLVDLGVNMERVKFIHAPIIPNAPATRYDFSYKLMETCLTPITQYTHVYVNDPLMMPHYRALFHLNKHRPQFILQTHFLDSPIARVVDAPLAYWYGTIDACDKADVFLWHCKSMQDVFEAALNVEFKRDVVDRLMGKSDVWKDGYSITEIRKPVNLENLRFDPTTLEGKTVVWVPNRVGGLGKSFDYTNNGKFLFDAIPKLWSERQDFIVIAGNPNQKISNDEIAAACPAYVKLTQGALNRDEYRWLSQRANIVVGMYTNDTNGGLASLEAIEHHAVPLFPDIYEYQTYFNAVKWPQHLRVKDDLSNADEVLSKLLDERNTPKVISKTTQLRNFIRNYAAYEYTTQEWIDNFRKMNYK